MYETTIDFGTYVANFGGYFAILLTAAIILLLTVLIITS